jgi:predicted metalloprotease with PDZ domain
MTKILRAAPLVLALSASSLALAQDPGRSAPKAVPIVQTVPDAADTPYGGTITLDIDATDTQRGVYRVTETIPVAAGTSRLTLLYPQWHPGTHGARGTMAELADIRFFAGGKPVNWTRDPVEVFAFHLDLPAGTRQIVAKFVNTSPLQGSEGRITMTQEMLNLQWEKMSLYPAGFYVRQINVKPTVTFPAGWAVATALDGKTADVSTGVNRVSWAVTDFETLVDSPIFAGAHHRSWDLGNRVTLHVVADKPEQLEAKPENIATLHALIDEALLAYGSHHWDHYEFLVALTDRMGGIGLER